MKIDYVETVVAKSHEFDSAKCVIDAEDMKYISSLLRNNYSNPILATVREIYANAIDANSSAGKDASSIILTAPTRMNPVFSVRDFGPGLSRDDMFNLYTKYGKSTKRGSDASIGGFGIGRLAPLSYDSAGFTITSFYNGTKSIYQLYINEENDTKLDELASESTTEENGLLISVGVKGGDVNSFRITIYNFFRTFDNLPSFVGIAAADIEKIDFAITGSNWKMDSGSQRYGGCRNSSNNCVVMGGIAYPLDLTVLNLEEDSSLKNYSEICGLYLFIPIGSVSLHHSRESLEYNTRTKQFILSALRSFGTEVKQKIAQEFSSMTCLGAANKRYSEYRVSFPYSLLRVLESNNYFQFQGVKVSGEYETRHFLDKSDPKNHVSKRIPIAIKEYYAKNGLYRVSYKRTYSLPFEEESCVVVNDLADGSAIITRVRPLLDGKYKKVYFVEHNSGMASRKDSDGVKFFCEANHVSLIKKDFFLLSSLPEVKIKRVSTGSRLSANFFFKVGQHCRFSPADTNKINDDSVQKAFVPIKNRKLNKSKYEALGFCDCSGDPSPSFFESFSSLVGICVYGVSSSICASKKFVGRTDFVSIESAFSEFWNNLSAEDKENIFTVLKSQKTYISQSSRYTTLLELANKGNCLPEIIEFDEKLEKAKAYISANNLDKVWRFLRTYSLFAKSMIPDFPKESEDIVEQTISKNRIAKYYLSIVSSQSWITDDLKINTEEAIKDFASFMPKSS